MAVDLTNIISSGDLPAGSAPNIFEASAGARTGEFHGFQPLGALVGIVEAVSDYLAKRLSSWAGSSIGTGGSVSLVAATAANPTLLRLTTGAAASNGFQVLSSDGAASPAAFARFFMKSGFNIHARFRFQYSNQDQAVLFGFTASQASILSTAGAVNADGIFLYKAPNTDSLVLHVRRGGASQTITVVTSGLAAGTWYDVGIRSEGVNSVQVFLNGEAVLDPTQARVLALAVNQDPNAALCLAAATTTTSANARTLDLARVCGFQESL